MENQFQSNSLQAEYERQREQQKKKNRRKVVIILICVVVFFAGIGALVFTMMKNSDAYAAAEYYIMHDQQIKNETGGVKELGGFPSGNISVTNGHGEALLSIDVKGNKKDLDLAVHLEKHPDTEWKVIEVREE